MKHLLRWLSRKRYPYEPLISVEVSRSVILANLDRYRALAPHGAVAPVLKSNAYGHGLFEVAELLEHVSDIPFIVVDSYFEAVALRAHGIRAALLIIGYTRPDTILHSRLAKTAFTVTSLDTLRDIAGASHKIGIHLKFDTGMRRQGLMPGEAAEAVRIMKRNLNLSLEGISTHLCDADDPDETFTRRQIATWNSLVAEVERSFPRIPYIHAAATDGSRYSKEIRATVNRLGIGLYRGALEMTTILTGVKRLTKGETVGYGNTFEAPRDMIIATVPVGYFEGIDRRLSNSGTVLIGDARTPCPIIGRVSMNIITVNVSAVPGAKIGMTAVVMSRETSAPNSPQAIARQIGTIDYEVLVRIPAHLKRVVVD